MPRTSEGRPADDRRLDTGANPLLLRNGKELAPISAAAPAFPLATAAIAPLRAKAESLKSGEFSPLWSGQNASGCKEVPAAQLTRELAAAVPGADIPPQGSFSRQ